ncbi:SDR family oxidoreductase [Bradyrhizobium sp. TZ2]
MRCAAPARSACTTTPPRPAWEGLTRGYAARLVKDGITVNAVAPSLIETDMMQGGPISPATFRSAAWGRPPKWRKPSRWCSATAT